MISQLISSNQSLVAGTVRDEGEYKLYLSVAHVFCFFYMYLSPRGHGEVQRDLYL